MTSTRVTTAQAEALISGTAQSPELEPIGSVIDALRAGAAVPIDHALIERIAFNAATRVRATSGEITSLSSGDRRRWIVTPLQSLRRRAAAVAATVALLIGGGAGAAIAANGASPGDVLYGLDQALEAVGIGDGGAEERLEEVRQLIVRGDVAMGLEHAADMIKSAAFKSPAASENSETAVGALRSAAERVKATRTGQTEAATEEVGELLTYLSNSIGNVDGQTVAELSLGIGNHPSPVGQGRGSGDEPGAPGASTPPTAPFGGAKPTTPPNPGRP